jgi:hypothetical protein
MRIHPGHSEISISQEANNAFNNAPRIGMDLGELESRFLVRLEPYERFLTFAGRLKLGGDGRMPGKLSAGDVRHRRGITRFPRRPGVGSAILDALYEFALAISEEVHRFPDCTTLQ